MNCVYVCLDSVNKHFGPQLLGSFLFVCNLHLFHLFIYFNTALLYLVIFFLFSGQIQISQDVFQLNKTIVKIRVKLEGHKFNENERGKNKMNYYYFFF